VFIAGRKVGPTGRAIGIDMTPEMRVKAGKNLEQYRHQSGLDNVMFRLGEIEHLPVADASVDVVISNCLINLSPDKAQALRVSEDDMTSTVNTAMAVKKMAERETLELADRMLSSPEAKVQQGGCCCSSKSDCGRRMRLALPDLVCDGS
jgi:SAM-dependent methyltransferase